ncbi:MAG: hypothetical protein PHU25_14950 [Deltaproteobacteria bacterium]|nr:hypothetical protein [Deltaproteobacteria bacterium]
MPLAETIEVTLLVTEALEKVGVPHVVGGSLASSLHGIPRATQDVDIVADIRPAHVDRFVAALEDGFFVDADMIRDAIRRRACFNVIHLKTMFKVDVFVFDRSPLSAEEMKRKETYAISEDPPRRLALATAEDIVLQKLKWYRLGDGVSDRQWGDVQGVLKVRGPRLDRGYLQRWAAELGVADLLERALKEAGLEIAGK